MTNIAALISAVGQLQIFSFALRYTVTMPSTTPIVSMQLVPCATSQLQIASMLRPQRPESVRACRGDAARCRIDGGARFGRRAADLDVLHDLQRADVIIRPRREDFVLGRHGTSLLERRGAEG